MTTLQITDLALDIPGPEGGRRPLLTGVNLDLGAGEALGLVGESGSGKSLTARAIMGLLPPRAATTGTIRVHDVDVLTASDRALRQLRSHDVAMIFQNPTAHLNPVRSIGDFLTEGTMRIKGLSAAEARTRAIELLESVRIDRPERVLRQYPHQLSGGMLQRVMIAGALACDPSLLLADEPTTALDVTIQAEVMAILGELRRERGVALLLITHDLELAAATCDRTAVMYAGSVVETGTSSQLLEHPRHPYTAGLGRSRPRLDRRVHRLPTIGGRPIAAFEAPAGCAFAGRCAFAAEQCLRSTPPLEAVGPAASVACFRHDELGDLGVREDA